ncbi:MAG: hypothetical protein LEGION0398_MBIBDBAK_00890 [Legionellaceae bacterium]
MFSKNPAPHFSPALKGCLIEFERTLLNQQAVIEKWFRQEWRKTPPPLYCSVDLRNAGFKLAPVDTNLFPAGFNNLNPDFLPLAIQAAQNTLSNTYTDCVKLLIIPENHTRNTFYFESLACLQAILMKAGYDVRIGSMSTEITEAQTINLPSGNTIYLEPLKRVENYLSVENYTPCLIILNHDLSDGIPSLLQGIQQPIIPSPELGWAKRLKSHHFKLYEQVSTEFAQLIDLDPWQINPLFDYCGNLNFLKREGEELLMQKTSDLLNKIAVKYKEYGITQKPFVIIKADSGTYGMGVMTIKDPNEIKQLNRKERTRMSSTKGNQDITQVLIQEGIYTFETVGKEHAVAEPVVYMMGCHVIGGFYRVHAGRDIDQNLNAPGMQFQPLAFSENCNNPDHLKNDCTQNRFYAYGVIARLALLAAAREAKLVEK